MTLSEWDKEGSVNKSNTPLSRSGESCILVFSGLNVHKEWKERREAPRMGCDKESREMVFSVNKSHPYT